MNSKHKICYHYLSWDVFKYLSSYHPLNPINDTYLISPCSNEDRENDPQHKKLWLLHIFSLSLPKEIYREEYGGYGYWCCCRTMDSTGYNLSTSIDWLWIL